MELPSSLYRVHSVHGFLLEQVKRFCLTVLVVVYLTRPTLLRISSLIGRIFAIELKTEKEEKSIKINKIKKYDNWIDNRWRASSGTLQKPSFAWKEMPKSRLMRSKMRMNKRMSSCSHRSHRILIGLKAHSRGKGKGKDKVKKRERGKRCTEEELSSVEWHEGERERNRKSKVSKLCRKRVHFIALQVTLFIVCR